MRQQAAHQQALLLQREQVPAMAAADEAATPPASPRLASGAAQQAQPAGQAVLTSPGKLDTLLPGYLSRPNPSPVKARLLAAPPVAPTTLPTAALAGMVVGSAGHSGSGAAEGERRAAPAAKRARSLVELAAERYGGAATNASAAPAPAAAAPEPAGRAEEAWDAQPPNPQFASAAMGAGAEAAAAATAAVAAAAASGGSAPAPAAVAPKSVASRGPRRGAGSKRKQPPSAVTAAGGAEASAAASAAAATPENTSTWLLQLEDVELDADAAALPLPPLARQLEEGFLVLAQLHAFLTRTHIQVGCWCQQGCWGWLHVSECAVDGTTCAIVCAQVQVRPRAVWLPAHLSLSAYRSLC